MSAALAGPRAFGGGPLIGNLLLRVVYVDETGHSRKEPVAVVGGIIIDPDRQWRTLADRVSNLVETEVPEEHRENFVFHATDLRYGGKYRKSWPDEDRWRTLDKLISLPRELSIPLVIGFWRKLPTRDTDAHRESIMSHALAHLFCLKGADWFMQNKAGSDEVAMLIAEERPEARKAIRATHVLLTDKKKIERWLPPFMHGELPITRIKGPPSFASKQEEVLLQIADACAFAIQRHINAADMCERFIGAMFGQFVQPAVLGAMRTELANFVCFDWPQGQPV